ncbi:MAG: energy-coupling factor transporter ATPase [Clostridia bacterium]|nr:energy-coupling factor transporter ATPase [Clostridia bacterium]
MPITVQNLSYTYSENTPMAVKALENVTLTIHEGEFIGIIGHTGSGKSTLVQHLNGLIPVQSGSITVDDIALRDSYPKKTVRTRVGMVFQYPEQQLFEETVAADIAFGPKNMGLSEEEQNRRVRHAMELMALDYSAIAERSPFELSGGQRRRVAIAGVLAMEPKYLILDEPAAGLDPEGRRLLLERIMGLHRETGIAVVMVSHSMDDIARCAQRVIVMEKGRIVNIGKPEEVFADAEKMEQLGLGVPTMAKVRDRLREAGLAVAFAATPEKMAENIAAALKERGQRDV